MMTFAQKLDCLVGLAVSDVIAGGANGSIIVLEFGGNYVLTVYCSWRLERGLQVLSGCNESPDSQTGHLTREAKSLHNDIVHEVSLSDHYDLRIEFTSGKMLRLFCDVTPHNEPADYDENWSFCDQAQDYCCVVTNMFRVEEVSYSRCD